MPGILQGSQRNYHKNLRLWQPEVSSGASHPGTVTASLPLTVIEVTGGAPGALPPVDFVNKLVPDNC